MKRCLTLLVMSGMQIKSTLYVTSYPLEELLPKRKEKGEKLRVEEDEDKLEPSRTGGGECKIVQTLCKIMTAVSRNWTKHCPIIQQFHSQVYYPKELKAGTQTGICTPGLTATLSAIVKIRSNPSVHQQTKRSTVAYTYVEYYSALKKTFWSMLQDRWTLKALR